MKVEQKKYVTDTGWSVLKNDPDFDHSRCQLVLVFGTKSLLQSDKLRQNIRDCYKNADIVYSSTSGQILGTKVSENSIVLSALIFEKTRILSVVEKAVNCTSCFDFGDKVSAKLDKKDLKYVLVVSDGQMVNGAELITGINSNMPYNVVVTGGLAGDGIHFGETFTGLNDQVGSGYVVAVGFYGEHFNVGFGVKSGWKGFGAEREVTSSFGNVLSEIDGENALALYKKYLGPKADELPESALLFPLSIQIEGWKEPIVRTVLSIDEENGTIKFAGDIPMNAKVRLMRTRIDNLIKASEDAAITALKMNTNQPEFTLLVSCVGRKLVLDHRVEEEIEAVNTVFKNNNAVTGFYSYGELSPDSEGSVCYLHNQTMTLTTYSES